MTWFRRHFGLDLGDIGFHVVLTGLVATLFGMLAQPTGERASLLAGERR